MGKLRYHNITKDDMLNGVGVRVVLWLSGCDHRCANCHNQLTWSHKEGIYFAEEAKKELFNELKKDYISGVTLSGGDPLYILNREEVAVLIEEIKTEFPDKTVWVYTGYTWDEIKSDETLFNTVKNVDVVVDGKFDENLKDIQYNWAGSKNQKVIDVKKSIERGDLVNYVHS